MQTQHIQITQTDYQKLQDLMRDNTVLRPEDKGCREALSRELMRAQIVSSEAVPSDVITLHSRALLRDLRTNDLMEFTIVLPQELDIEVGRISIFAPLGTAMLGYKEGDIFEWETPGGQSRFRVEEILFQPEAMRQDD